MTWRRAARFRRDRRGVAATEAAYATAVILVPLALGVIDIGVVVADMARLDRALQAAAFAVWSSPSNFIASPLPSAATSAISTAANAGFGSAAPTPTVSASTACYCVTSGYSKGSSVSCSGSCTSGTVGAYVTITVSATFTLPIAVPYFSSSLSQSVSGTIRTQ
jgi:Flp pilus assembly protein TadG